MPQSAEIINPTLRQFWDGGSFSARFQWGCETTCITAIIGKEKAVVMCTLESPVLTQSPSVPTSALRPIDSPPRCHAVDN